MNRWPITIIFGLFLIFSNSVHSKTLVYCSEGSPSSFNPQLATDAPSFNASARPIYNRLVEFKEGTTNIEPSLAESWTIAKDGKTYTFKLRPNVKFHSTDYFKPKRNFNADDVIFTIERMLDKKHPFHKVSGGVYEFFSSMDMANLITKVEKVDALTVRFHLSRPEAPFLANMAMDFLSVLSAEYATEMLKAGTPEKVDTLPIGTGPFIFKKYVKDSIIRFTANKEYFLGEAKISNLVFTITPDPTVRFQKLKTGECHLVAEPNPMDIHAMQSTPGVKVVSGAGLNVGYLAMNTQKKPFDNLDVRRAINLALNKKAYIQAIYMGQAQVAKNPIPPTLWGFNSQTKDYEYDPQKAKELLAKAGFPSGFETEIWTLPISRPYNPNGKKMGEMMQADLAKVGIKVKLVTYDWPTYLDKASRGEHQMVQLGWSGDNGDPDNFLFTLLGCAAVQGGGNLARWCFKPYEDLVLKAKLANDQKTRAKFYYQAQETFKKEAPWVTLAHATAFRALSAHLQHYQLSPVGSESFYPLDIQ